MRRRTKLEQLLAAARAKLYDISGGKYFGGQAGLASITTAQRIEFFGSSEFLAYVKASREAGIELFWLKDLDKTQASGDIFTKFFAWRAHNRQFSSLQLQKIENYLTQHDQQFVRSHIESLRSVCKESNSKSEAGDAEFRTLLPGFVLHLWKQGVLGNEGLNLLDFWSGVYWPSQIGFTKEEKLRQVTEFAPHYAASIYPGVADENRALEAAGVHVVIVSNGDQELAISVAQFLGVKPENVVGSHLIYDENNFATGVNHSYDFLGGKEWEERPQGGKVLSFHYWLHINRARFGWQQMHDDLFQIAGRDGDSASSDGGMMILHKPAVFGNFMVDTPGEPGRLKKFRRCAAKYGFTAGQFFTLVQEASVDGAI